MLLQYETHNFDTNQVPRRYEAIYKAGENLVVKVYAVQDNVARGNGKPMFKWRAAVLAWAPGQADTDWIALTHLRGSEIALREVAPHEATEEIWLEAARIDAARLTERAQVFTDVLAAAMTPDRKRRLKAA